MDFQNVNPLNVWINFISGNLFPMTADDTSFSVLWKIYSILLWLLELVQVCMLIPGCILVPKEKALKDGMVGLVVTFEVTFMVTRIHTCKRLMRQLIQSLNDILHAKDELMRNIVVATLKPMETPLKFYLMAGVLSIIIWSSTPFVLVYQKDVFFYVDFRMPVAYTREPFSTTVFVIGSLVVLMSSIYIFIKKVSVDSYMMHLILMITAQYRYVALKLSMIFQDKVPRDDGNSYNEKKHRLTMDYRAEKDIKALCRHHNTIVQMTLMLRNLLSLNFSLIYVNSIFRFCGIAIMVFAIPSTTLLETTVIIMYASGGIVQLYLLCSCVQQLLDATIEITDKAFHEEWYRYGGLIKRTFIMIIMANNLECKLSTFGKFNLSLPSFMTILNSSYSIALLLLKTN
ncbi:ObirOr5-A5 [Ooceraea biroi]|uniref:Odorant receptor n=1 Tax=Ooceraea biroi TaxID=2015173 RepID=A0A026X109_OOCBI|nr:uncharacterized protein LOC105283127 [Ooceraea biroi]EZA61768.1 hypothetical protein X777_09389 [Ooceraea biroi]RLU24238.1 ObirOr5-A5 [Ooceraea biroi]